MEDLLSPSEVLAQVSQALPADVRPKVIIIGSLAAGFHFFSRDGARAIRTKDVDCLISPHAAAVAAASEVADQLLASNWTLRQGADWNVAGTKDDPVEKLPLVRLRPPGAASGWFLELLSAPPAFERGAPARKQRPVQTSQGYFSLCSFDFLALVEWEPLSTVHEVSIARPEMMALANLLHHPAIDPTLISGTSYKRSNKDLGRVLALAYLTAARDRRDGEEELGRWPSRMWLALKEKFGPDAQALALRAGNGMRALLESTADLDEALRLANLGLLSSLEVSRAAFQATGARFMVEVIDELEGLAR